MGDTAKLRLFRVRGAGRRAVAVFLALSALPTARLDAALTYNGDILPADPSKWNTSTTAYVGKVADGNLTVNAASALSSYVGYVGYNAGITGTVTVTGTNSTWSNYTSLYVGNLGTGALNITNGGKVSNINAFGAPNYLGYNSGSTGTAAVDGAGSTWTNYGILYVGNTGAGRLNITNGGNVTSSSYPSYIGYNSGSSGTATVDGLNSSWANSSLYLGNTGSGTLSITNGGKVTCSSSSYLGYGIGSSGTATVDGLNSSWANSSLYLGNTGSGTLSIINGGKVTCSSSSYLGYGIGSSGTATVDGLNSSWTSNSLAIGNSGSGTLNITNSGVVTVNGVTTVASIGGSTGTINFGAKGGTLTTQALYAGRSQVIGTGTINARGLVSDGDSVFDATHGPSQTMIWNSAGQNVTVKLDLTGASGTAGDLGAGYQGTGTLAIRNAVTVKSANGYLGYKAGSNGTATVNGAGSTWTNSSLYVGYSGNGTLSIVAGAAVSSSNAGDLGYNSGSTGMVTVDGAGSAWTNGGLYVGYSGNGTLNIRTGAKVNSSNASDLGYNSGSSGIATVDGPGSAWTTGGLYVGASGTGTLNITNGGNATSSSTSYLGYNSGSSGTATVNGGGSIWTNSSDLYIANSGSATLNITSGGKVASKNGLIGVNAGSIGNITVDGLASVWTNTNNLTVGGSGSGALNITNNGSVTVAGSTAVGSVGAINFGTQGGILTTSSLMAPRNQVTGTGTINTRGLYDDGNLVFNAASGPIATEIWGSAQQNVRVKLDLSGLNGPAGDLGVGYQSNGTLTVQDGVTIQSSSGHLGYSAGSNGTATVDGAGSTWSDAGGLYVGRSGIGALNILRGGNVAATDTSCLGYNSGATGIATVDGVTTRWNNSSNLYVGYSGTGSLSIVNGGQVKSVNNTASVNDIGYNTGSSGTVTVDGAGSNWTIVDGINNSYRGLVVGSYGTGALKVTNGAVVTSGNSGYVAEWVGSSGTVTVDGPGSAWNNGYELKIGYSGTGSLNITNGGLVNSSVYGSNGGSSIGNNPGSTGVVTVDGSGSIWNNNGFLNVGNAGDGTLNITGGGTVILAGATYIAAGGGTGVINFGANGGTLTTAGLYGPRSHITGTGTINTRGVYYDGDLVFDATHGPVQTQIWQGPQQNVTLNLDLSGSSGAAGDLAVGYQASGTLTIHDGLKITTAYGYLAHETGTTGAAIVDGPGSTWNYSNSLYVGLSGTGSLRIVNGGSVNGGGKYGYIFLGSKSGSSGTATVDGAGSNWTVTDLYRLYVGYGSTGTLNITNGGSLNIRSTESASDCYIGYNGGSGGSGGPANVTVDGIGSTWTYTNDTSNASQTFSVGHGGAGTLRITNGGNVICSSNNISHIGNGGPGIVTVDGAGSSWITGKQLSIGDAASGELDITGGGHVSSGIGYVSHTYNAPGTARVDGAGSSWTVGAQLYIGISGSGVLSITNGGNVTASSLTIGNATSVLAINAGDGSNLDVGTGAISNKGIIRIRAARNAVSGQAYAPINAGSWTGSGKVQAVGGTWNASTRQFTISPLATGISGSPVIIDCQATQRLLVTDPMTDNAVYASFPSTPSTSYVTFTAASLTDAQDSLLQPSLASGTSLLAGWTFATAGYITGDPVFLSIAVGPEVDASTLDLWHFDGTTWSAYTASDLAYDGAYVNFTVTGFSGYAVSGVQVVPEPTGLSLLALAGVAGLSRPRRTRVMGRTGGS